jgi:hypothetical protein
MAPLGLLSFAGAYQTWSVLSIVVLWLCCWQMWQTTGAMPMPWRVVAILAFVTLYPLAYSLRQGQFSLWLVAGLGGAYNSLRAGRDRSAGVWLSLLLLKPELVVPIAAVLAWKRRCGVFTTLAPITAACVVASIAVVGPPEALRYPMYLRNISLQHATGTFTPEMFGWTGLVGAPLGAEHPKLALAIHIPLALATLGAVAVLWRGPWRADDGQFSSRWFALILATLLADPHLYLQDTILVVPAAIAWVSSERAAGRAGEFFVVLLGWTILGLGTSPNLNWHVNLFATLMALVTAMLVARGMWHSRTAGDSERTARDAVVLAALG